MSLYVYTGLQVPSLSLMDLSLIIVIFVTSWDLQNIVRNPKLHHKTVSKCIQARICGGHHDVPKFAKVLLLLSAMVNLHNSGTFGTFGTIMKVIYPALEL